MLDLTLETLVVPFRSARSRSWITAEGPDTARTLVIEPASGWMERGGGRVELPPALIAHERQQYAIYGYLLRALRTGAGGAAAKRFRHPGFPDARFLFDGEWPRAAAYRVSAPEAGDPPVAQRFTFADPMSDTPLRWPRRLSIEQAGRPYFDLTIDRFEASA